MRFFAELRRRNVFRFGAAYLVVAWLLLQIADTLVPALHLPAWVVTAVVLFLIIGFPPALAFAWAFELTPEGLKRESDVRPSESITHRTGRKLDFLIIGALAISLGYFAFDKLLLDPKRDAALVESTKQAVQEQAAAAADAQKSIAVLPFVNISDDPGNEYFSDGLSEEILNLLAKTQDLKVIARTSSFAFKGKNEDIRTIGATLGVSTVLEGSVRKAGNRVRITAQLIQVADGAHIWSETYDRTLTDIFAIQDDVAAAIIDALQLHVGTKPTRGRPTDSTEAYSLFLQARAILNAYESRRDAETILLEAIELDPGFAEAQELLAFTYWFLAGTEVPSAVGQRQAAEAAAKALAIDPDLAFARALFASANIDDYSFIGEIRALERAAREAPSNTELLDALVYDLVYGGYLRDALGVAERSVDLDPLSAGANIRLFETLYSLGRTDEALAALELAAELGGTWPKQLLARFKFWEFDDDTAIKQLEAEGDRPVVPWPVYRRLVAGARDPAGGPAYLDRRIPEVLGTMEEKRRYFARWELTFLYLRLGFLHRYFDLILESDLTASTWTDADNWIYSGTIWRRTGFTAHPRYLEVAELVGIVDAWEKRGPPDFCNKLDGRWTCE